MTDPETPNPTSPRPDASAGAEKPEALLPLPSATFHILLALADVDRHGYGIIQDVAGRTRGALRLSPGTLYRTIQRLLEQGLIVETSDRPAPAQDDERRRYYRLTDFGRAVARAEADRLVQLVELARLGGFVGDGLLPGSLLPGLAKREG